MHDSIIFNLREVWYDEMAAVIGMLYMYVYWAHMRYSTRCSLKLNLQNKTTRFKYDNDEKIYYDSPGICVWANTQSIVVVHVHKVCTYFMRWK